MRREKKEALEAECLHPAASKAAESAGRVYPEPEDPLRTCFERDRDRIIHCSAFRRLEYKTQVFVNHVGDHHRTRLTHSLEVVQVARSLANGLDLNEALVEAVALAHDVGHPPCGHTGEKRLHQWMKDHGGFNHNVQAIRVVTLLEQRSPAYPGLNLTQEVLQCLRKHQKAEDPATGRQMRHPRLEMQLVDLADSTAYHYHDLDDGLRAGILDPKAMERELPLWAMATDQVRREFPEHQDMGEMLWRRAANEVLSLAIHDIQDESVARLEAAKPDSALAAQEHPQRLIGHSKEFKGMVAQLHEYLYANMYYDDRINWFVRRSTDLVEKVFEALLEHPQQVPERFHENADSLHRAVCDYVSGMTDRYVEVAARQLGIIP
ncbi:MAG: dNTP triphosphohydrolase [Planctomycetota bacterium]|nr:MAG: dNTP triphosphohydrolase [Planctomycetota bacterium]